MSTKRLPPPPIPKAGPRQRSRTTTAESRRGADTLSPDDEQMRLAMQESMKDHTPPEDETLSEGRLASIREAMQNGDMRGISDSEVQEALESVPVTKYHSSGGKGPALPARPKDNTPRAARTTHPAGSSSSAGGPSGSSSSAGGPSGHSSRPIYPPCGKKPPTDNPHLYSCLGNYASFDTCLLYTSDAADE